eukprot:CAMPEP_0185727096 /NCGR_PEP_ID=MMETSP1171-20130828/2884_1 /TAXON_ID=374046 /ORGANISM="Helicotheca tamensis, Strain CCMP826" /LENGTH=138 /DNA_ID=CAMNT_0028395593 /DNA_START=155 /DNA_END=571 /DNA_ORIENTATION=+
MGNAVGILLFWVGFYTEAIFPVDVLSTKIKNFDGYYAWESSFTVPDVIMAAFMIIACKRLLSDAMDVVGRLLLIACSGGVMFLGVLDFTYAIRNGMYELDHFFSYILLSIGLGLPPLSFATIYVLMNSFKESDQKKKA